MFCFPRNFAYEHLIVDDSKSPNIALETVLIGSKDFKRHVVRRADVDFLEFFGVFSEHGESKISNFNLFSLQQNVTWL
jgi:hypothetical protein